MILLHRVANYLSILGWLAVSMGTFAQPAPKDTAIANKDQILYWLQQRGELAADAPESAKAQALAAYLSAQPLPKVLQQQLAKERTMVAKASQRQSKSAAKVLQLQATTASNKTVKVLAVLIDFPDLPYNANQLSSADTDMYYSNYLPQHYDDLLFSSTGFSGPSGQTLDSVFQYYQAVSGNSFNFTGAVKGWFTASQNAAYYGANDSSGEGNDSRVTELVAEAVAQAAATMTASELAAYDVEDPYDLDGDGNLDEADGVLDHVMIFHSSIGEESGGGVLGADAIWSHRFFVPSSGSGLGQLIPGTSKRVYGYTIQPIDAAMGVCSHEFGHDLGLPDEYDTSATSDGEPVGQWSLMSSGSWTGTLAGSKPSGFSPYARAYLQDRYQGNWLQLQTLDYEQLTAAGTDITLYQASNSEQLNQLLIQLPATDIPLTAPYGGDYQYYSGQGNNLNHALSFELQLPASSQLQLTMQARWDMEANYDYAQVLVDGVAVAGNYTLARNSVNSASNIITGSSADLAAADNNGWVTLSFDLSAYAGMNKQISVLYKTDESVGGDGLQLDNLLLTDGTTPLFQDNVEQPNSDVTLSGFIRTGASHPGAAQQYLLQLRSQNGVDAGLKSAGYDGGLLLWLANPNYADNNASEHPGYGFIGVVDADQHLISGQATEVQLRDAAFSLYNQSFYYGDDYRGNNSLFDDRDDYRAAQMPQAGLLLPALGVTVELLSQAQDNTQAILRIAREETQTDALTAAINSQAQGLVVSFTGSASGGSAPYQYLWSFGDGSTSPLQNPQHSYSSAGNYTVTLTVTDATAETASSSRQLSVSAALQAAFSTVINGLQVQFSNNSSGGTGTLSYQWDFGDGGKSTEVSPSHSYSAAGVYSVTLTASDSSGNQGTMTQSVTVNSSSGGSNTTSKSGGGALGPVLWLLVGIALSRARGNRARFSRGRFSGCRFR